jgi:hypothetical protein
MGAAFPLEALWKATALESSRAKLGPSEFLGIFNNHRYYDDF